MKYTYEEKTTVAPAWTYIERSDGAVIPIDLGNSDYQRYLRWLENPNEAAQSTPTVTEQRGHRLYGTNPNGADTRTTP